MTKVNIPEGMLRRAEMALHGKAWEATSSEGRSDTVMFTINEAQDIAEATLEAALVWLSENPIEPSTAQALTMLQERVKSGHLSGKEYCAIPATTIRKLAAAWQRRMFFPEVE